jgi:hypothetical protein
MEKAKLMEMERQMETETQMETEMVTEITAATRTARAMVVPAAGVALFPLCKTWQERG